MMAHAQASRAKNIEPAFRHHRQVVLAWATGVWTLTPCRPRYEVPLPGSAASRGRGAAPQQPSGWAPHHPQRHDDRSAGSGTDSSAHWDNSNGPLFWGAIRALLAAGKLEGWSLWHRIVLVKLVSRGIWTQDRLSRLRDWEDDLCQLCHEGPGTTFHRCYECPALQTELDMCVSLEVRQAARSLEPQSREQFAHSIYPRPSQILPTGAIRQPCPVLWHSRPPDGLLEGHIFTDGSSAGSVALRRAGWAVVAVDGLGNLKEAAYGAIPTDVVPGQRDGEDNAAVMAGTITIDPLTLHIDCEGTIATINGPKRNAWGAGGPVSGAGFFAPTMRLGQFWSRATLLSATWRRGAPPTFSKGETMSLTPSQRREQTHTSLLFG